MGKIIIKEIHKSRQIRTVIHLKQKKCCCMKGGCAAVAQMEYKSVLVLHLVSSIFFNAMQHFRACTTCLISDRFDMSQSAMCCALPYMVCAIIASFLKYIRFPYNTCPPAFCSTASGHIGHTHEAEVYERPMRDISV